MHVAFLILLLSSLLLNYRIGRVFTLYTSHIHLLMARLLFFFSIHLYDVYVLRKRRTRKKKNVEENEEKVMLKL